MDRNLVFQNINKSMFYSICVCDCREKSILICKRKYNKIL